ncbi:hypothetical protein BKA62DRAFT_723606 [Auriculariales sp. MPI-PUGE-AT-0066]|nr:hypothetical protein BKA62DRAFT_723606 [Auriculariales sp. MPI-PUGE-AT-0066]
MLDLMRLAGTQPRRGHAQKPAAKPISASLLLFPIRGIFAFAFRATFFFFLYIPFFCSFVMLFNTFVSSALFIAAASAAPALKRQASGPPTGCGVRAVVAGSDAYHYLMGDGTVHYDPASTQSTMSMPMPMPTDGSDMPMPPSETDGSMTIMPFPMPTDTPMPMPMPTDAPTMPMHKRMPHGPHGMFDVKVIGGSPESGNALVTLTSYEFKTPCRLVGEGAALKCFEANESDQVAIFRAKQRENGDWELLGGSAAFTVDLPADAPAGQYEVSPKNSFATQAKLYLDTMW